MNYYEHHIGDYDADTAHLSWLEDMAYTRLMRLYYRKEAPIPAAVADACRLVRAATKEHRQAVESVLHEFFTLAVDGWHQKRCDADVVRYQAKAERNREVGKLGGRPRKVETQTKPPGLFVGSHIEPKQNPLQSPDTRHQEEKEHTHARLPDGWVLPKAFGEWAIAEYPHWTPAVVRAIAEQFADHWRADGGVSLDWAASWRKWCRDELTQRAHGAPKVAPFSKPAPSATVPSNADKATQSLLADAKRHADEAAAITPEQHAARAKRLRETRDRLRSAA